MAATNRSRGDFRCLVVVTGVAVFLGCGSDRTQELIQQLQDPDAGVRRSAARTLADMGVEASVSAPALRSALKDKDRDVRRLAIHALTRVDLDVASQLDALTEALNDDELSVRLAAALAIERIAPEELAHQEVLINAMKMGEGGIIVEVGQYGEQAAWAVPTLTELLTDRRPGIRRITANALQDIGPAAIAAEESLSKLAEQDPDDRVRTAAEDALARIRS